ncbi:cardiolipin synthase [Streptomyces sp. NP160]|uniref:cardiolipin synthase n=1 Tax=Streptomyces sp. NP160 TaxID=2586637 RepID=UPI001C58B839|nr:cardiolipin synthase [Streptomyces sp. NP160]
MIPISDVLPDSLPEWAVWLVVAVGVLVGLVVAAVIANDRRPSAALGWVLAVVLIPYLGLLAFLVIGSPKLPRARREKQRRFDQLVLERTTTRRPVHLTPPEEQLPVLRTIHAMNRRLGAMPVLSGNTADLLEDYVGSLWAMTAEVEAAQHSVHAEFYILALDETTEPFFGALERAAARGVVVRVLFDHLASLRVKGYRRMVRRLEASGVLWQRVLPVFPTTREVLRIDLRNHRKLLVVDGAVGFSGSQNVVDPAYGKRSNRRKGRRWVDVMARFEGPVVTALDAVFVADWFSETGELLDDRLRTDVPPAPDSTRELQAQVVPSGPGYEQENNLRLFVSLLHAAQERAVVVSPYFVPDESLLLAMRSAAERGLDVQLFVSERGDQALVHHAQRSYYDALLRSGVRIFMYPPPFVLHAKTLSVDDEVAVIGSSNLDMRSFELNLEVTVLVRGADFSRQLRAVEDLYRSRSRELTAAEWGRRDLVSRTADGLARLASALV